MLPDPLTIKQSLAALIGAAGAAGSAVLAYEVSEGTVAQLSILVIGIGCGVGGWMVRLLLQMRDQLTEARGTDHHLNVTVADHETRIRSLESLR